MLSIEKKTNGVVVNMFVLKAGVRTPVKKQLKIFNSILQDKKMQSLR